MTRAALLLTALLAIFLTACSGPKNTPDGVAVAFIERSYKGDVNGAMSLVHLPDSSKPGKTEMAQGKMKAMIAKASEIDADDPNRARVALKVRFKQGEGMEKVRLIQVEGKWKIFASAGF